jgi:DNA-binding SARP family transcriptional activator
MVLRIALLGPLHIERDGALLPEREWHSRQERRLLVALLSARAMPIPASRLIEWFWPTADPETAAVTLRSAISSLRRTLASGVGRASSQYIQTRAGGYAWNHSADAWIDLEAFYAGVESNDPLRTEADLERAIALYRGDLYEDELDAPWLFAVRGQVRERFLRAATELAERQIRRAAFLEAIRTAQRGLAFDPLCEPLCRALMQSQTLIGDVAAALQCYERFRVALDHELGASPSALTRTLHAAILRGEIEPELHPAPELGLREHPIRKQPRHVHMADPPLLGRENELAQIRAWMIALERRQGGVIALVGEAGIGKSRLLAEVTREAHQRGAQPIGLRCTVIERGMPFAALIEALRPLIRAAPDAFLRRLPRTALAQLAELIPALAERVRDLPTLAALPPAESRSRLLEGIVELAIALSRLAPLVICCDDAQWADDGSLAALSRLSKQSPRRALLIVLAYRAEELAESPALHALLRELGRDMLLRPLLLGPLNDQAAIELLAGPAHQRTERLELLAQRLAATSAGNPLLLHVAAQSLLEGYGVRSLAALPAQIDVHAPLPDPWSAPPIRDLIGARLDRLPAAARVLLEQVAILGRSVSLDLIEALGDAAALDHAQLLLDRQFLLDIGGERLDFVYDTVRATIIALLGSPRRRLLHRQAAQALIALHGPIPERAPEIAHHLTQSGRGVEPQLLHYATVAADHMRLSLGYREALVWYDTALSAVAGLGVLAPVALIERASVGRAEVLALLQGELG